MAPLIELDRVGRRFADRVALRDVTLRVRPGERVVLLGPSGSGKTTLLRLVGGALRASEGSVRVDGMDTNAMSSRTLKAHRMGCGVVDQGNTLVAELDVHQNIVAGLLAGWPPHRILASILLNLEKRRVRDLLARVGLEDRQWDMASVLSGGERQRVSIARALVREPRLILADEPTASLDPTTARSIVELLLESARAHNASLLLSTHWASLVTEHVDRLIGIRQGAVVFDKPAPAVTDAELDGLYQGSRERR